MIPLQNLQDLALDDSEHSFFTPRGGDWALLALVIITLLGTGLFAWHQLDTQGQSGDHAGRAIFFAFVIICIYWSATLYAFKLSVSIRVGPSSMSVVRGPWRTELPWREVVRLVERTQVVDGQRLRWAVALARDDRRMQIREDMVDDYVRFRMELYERYRLWRDHGGTWSTTGGGPFATRETISTQVTWWGVAAGLLLLPGLYFLFLLPESGLLGPALLGLGLICTLLSLRALARRQTYRVDAKAIEASWFGRTVRLSWREVARVDRTRRAWSGAIRAGIVIGRFTLKLAMRNDKRMRSFEWSPRVPEYLVIRGAGHQIRVSLHRVARPDELLAWVEFYERVGRRASLEETRRKKSAPPDWRPSTREPMEPVLDRSDPLGGPTDPWSGGAGSILSEDGAAPVDSLPGSLAAAGRGQQSEGDWLRGDDVGGYDALFEDEDEDQPTQKVPLAAMLASASSPEEPAPAEEDLEEFPTAEMKAAFRDLQPSSLTPPFGSETIRETPPQYAPANSPMPAVPQSGLAGSGEIVEIPANHSLDQLWAPIRPLTRERTEAHHANDADSIRAAFVEMTLDQEEPEANVDAIEDVDPEAEAEKPPIEPVETDENLQESFAPWRNDASWRPPSLPRYGPPLPAEGGDGDGPATARAASIQ